MRIIADARERNGAIPFLEAAVAESNREMGEKPAKVGGGVLTYAVETITRGDYAWTAAGELMAVAERKTWKDLAASIKGERSTTQDAGLQELRAGGVFVFYIIEGKAGYKDDFQVAHMKFSALHARIRRNMLRGIPFIQTSDEQGTARLVIKIARDLVGMRAKGEARPWERRGCDLVREVRRLCEQFPEHELTARLRELVPGGAEGTRVGAEGVGVKENGENGTGGAEGGGAGGLPAELTVRRSYSAKDLEMRVWFSLKGVSEKTAAVLCQHYTLEQIFSEDLTEGIAALGYDSGTTVGMKRARKIVACCRDASYHVDILCSLPQVTPEKAEVILGAFSMARLCSGRVLGTEIAELRLASGRKVGVAVGRTILTALVSEDGEEQRRGESKKN